MGTSKKFPILRRGTLNTLIVRIEREEDRLDFLNFIENEEDVFYEDTSGYQLPLKMMLIESQTGTFGLSKVRKNRLAEKMCTVMGETPNYYIVKGNM